MSEVDTKKALAFIRNRAADTPKTINRGYVIPEEIAKEIRTQIDKHNGSFAISKEELNKVFEWSEKNPRNLYLKKKLNLQYPIQGKEWHVGLINKGELYKFEIKDVKEETEEEDEETEE